MGLVTQDALAAALVQALAAAIEAGLAEAVVVAPGAADAGPAWTSTVTVGGALTGTLAVSVSDTGARAIADRLLRLDHAPDAAVLGAMLGEMWAQAIGAVAGTPDFAAVTLTAEAPVSGPTAGGRGWVLSVNAAALAQVMVAGTLAAGVATAPLADPASGRVAATHGADDPNLAVLMDIDLPLVVRFARTDLTLKALTELGPGSIVDMGRSPEDPVEILVGGQVVAQGEVVVVGGNYGVRIINLLGPAERLRALEA